MASVYQFSQTEILAFFLVLVRMSAFVVTWPVFGVNNVPPQLKILLAFVLSLVIFPVVSRGSVNLDLASMMMVFAVAKEAFIGLIFGFLGKMYFYAVHIGGQIITVSMGLSGAEVFDPSAGARSSAVDQVYIVLATLFFLAIQGHHLFLSGIADSFRILPISASGVDLTAFQNIGQVVTDMMIIGLKLSGPVMVSIFFMNLSMAIIGRAVPQINVLITSLPVNIMVGFIIMIVSLPVVVWQMDGLLEISAHRLFQILKAM